MQAIILAAGKGTRLGRLGLERSKGALPIAGKPILGRVMEAFKPAGVTQVIVVLHPQDEELENYLRSNPIEGMEVEIAIQVEPRGTAHALQSAAGSIQGDFFLSACDNLVHESVLKRMHEVWRSDSTLNGLLALFEFSPGQEKLSAIVELEGNKIQRIVEKPGRRLDKPHLASSSLYCFTPRILEYLQDVPLSVRGENEIQDAIQHLITSDGGVRGFILPNRDSLTTVEDFLRINITYLKSVGMNHALEGREDLVIKAPVLIQDEVRVGARCGLGPNVYLEAGCEVGEGASLQDVVVLRTGKVPAGAEVISKVVY